MLYLDARLTSKYIERSAKCVAMMERAVLSTARLFVSLVPLFSRKSSTDMYAFSIEQEITVTNLDKECPGGEATHFRF